MNSILYTLWETLAILTEGVKFAHELKGLCSPQAAHDTLSDYRRQKSGFGASWDCEVIDSTIDGRIINFILEIISYFVDAISIVR